MAEQTIKTENVKLETAKWTMNTAATEWTYWTNDADGVARARGRVYQIDSSWTGLYAPLEDNRKYRLADGFEAPQHARHALTEAIAEGPGSPLWSKPAKIKRRGRPANDIGV